MVSFYDVKLKKKINVNKYETVKKRTKKGRVIAMIRARSPESGIMMYRIISNTKVKLFLGYLIWI
jgi:hypothetical protein